MGRRRVALQRIENKYNRQVTFSKRRTELKKKAAELAVLCDAKVALIIFSSTGKISEYTSNNMLETLEKYEKASYSTPEKIMSEREGKMGEEEEEADGEADAEECIREEAHQDVPIRKMDDEEEEDQAEQVVEMQRMRLRIQELEGQLAQLTGERDIAIIRAQRAEQRIKEFMPTISGSTA